ncbi:MAG: outer membrane protein transport protein, partial [Candidatus Omnitrophica bacterium]|nr:outer membrane protein transport protein [Candidatus Omnitrophota bacterium]
SFSRYVATKTELTNIDSMLTVSYAINDNISMGVGMIYDVSEISKSKALNQQPGSDGFSQLKGEDDAFGYTVSGLFKVNEKHQFGLQYRSIIESNYVGKVHLDSLSDAGSTPLATIFGGANYTTRAEASLTLPQSIVLGYSFRPTDRWVINLDAEWMDWSTVEQERVSFPDESNATRLAVLTTSTSSDKDWKSVMSIGVGTEYKFSEETRLRAGYFWHQTPIPEGTFDTTLPDSDSHGFNLGFGVDMTEDLTLDLAWTGIMYEKRDVNNAIGNSVGADLDGKYRNFTNLFIATLNYSFQ